MRNNTVPCAVGTTRLADHYDFGLVLNKAVDARVDNFISLAYALSGGQSAALVVKRFVE
jgi:hypothetical protein